MNAYVALFRGINVGGKNLLPMKELLPALEALKLGSPRSYIQSGNVVFTAKEESAVELEAEIAEAVEGLKGFRPEVLVLSASDFAQVIAQNPFPTGEGRILHAFLLKAAATKPRLDAVAELRAGDEDFHLGELAFYLFAPEGIGRSKLASRVEKLLGVPVTARNWNTVAKLESLLGELL